MPKRVGNCFTLRRLRKGIRQNFAEALLGWPETMNNTALEHLRSLELGMSGEAGDRVAARAWPASAILRTPREGLPNI